MKAHPRAKLALLILLTLLGCVAVAWLGSQRPERQIVGKWRTRSDSVIEFRADGTFDWQSYTLCEHRERGRWKLAERAFLVLRTESERDCPISDRRPSHPLREGTITIEGGVAHVSPSLGIPGAIWKRIESPVND